MLDKKIKVPASPKMRKFARELGVNINQIRIAGRSTQGVKIFKIPDGDKIVSVSRLTELNN